MKTEIVASHFSLLASLNENSACSKLNCFSEAEDNEFNNFKTNNIINRAIRNCWKKFCDVVGLVAKESLPEWDMGTSFSAKYIWLCL